MVRVLYRLGRYILYSFLPLWILVSSLAFHIPNAQYQKQYFEDRNIYENFTTEVNNIEDVGDFSFEKLVQFSLLQNLINPSFTRDIVEQNIDITTEWLRGETDTWTLYLPSEKVSDTLRNELNKSIPAFANVENIPVCDEETTATIQAEGFSEDTTCLPQAVIDGQQNLDQITGTQNFDNNFLKSIQPDTVLNTNTDRVLAQTSSISDQFSDIIIRLRDLFVFIQRSLVAGWIFSISLMVAVLCLGILAGKSWVKMVREISFRIGLGSVGIFFSYMIFTGLSLIISSGTSSFLFPAIPGANVIAFINTEALWWLAFQGSWLFWSAGIGIGLWIISFFIPNINLFKKSANPAPRKDQRSRSIPADNQSRVQGDQPLPFDANFQKEVEDVSAELHQQMSENNHTPDDTFTYVESDKLNAQSSVGDFSPEGSEKLTANLESELFEEDYAQPSSSKIETDPVPEPVEIQESIVEADVFDTIPIAVSKDNVESVTQSAPAEDKEDLKPEPVVMPVKRPTSIGTTIEDTQDPEQPPTRKIQF